ncbi:hypothetical protein MNB_SV-4-1052 [hydrothermal vent metagenome]|uniref:LIM zinc-binding domain-containing protein n=1 Tax=hydrothermal vent metagenome TaxID=652676 RepID=A0A1W1E7G9_9ZZZZ
MSSNCFVTQIATKDVLVRVTNVCSECYTDLKEGDTIHYDMQNYRFLCDCCQQKFCLIMNEQCEIVHDKAEPSLFC